jgi:predicted NACHT family NTPase
MSLVVTAAAGAVAREVFSRAITGLTGSAVGGYSVEIVSVGEQGDPDFVLTDRQYEILQTVLVTSEVSRLVQAAALLHASVSPERFRDSLGQVGAAFQDVVSSRLRESEFPALESLAPLLWRKIEEFVSHGAPKFIAEVSSDLVGKVLDPLGVSTLLDGREIPTPAYIRALLDTTSTPDRLTKVRQDVSDIRDALRPDLQRLRLSHLNEDEQPVGQLDRAHLYIERSLLSPAGVSVTTGALTAPDRPRRAVVLGDPGVGKTTLVEHAMWQCP